MDIHVLLNNDEHISNCIYNEKKVPGIRLEFYLTSVSLPLYTDLF